MSKGPGRLFTAAWVSLAVASGLLILAGAYILYSPGDATWFSGFEALDLDALAESSPELAKHVTLLTRLLSVACIGFGIYAMFVTWFGVRDLSPLSISIMWTLPILLGVLGLIVILLDGNGTLGLGFALIAVVLSFALVIARRHT